MTPDEFRSIALSMPGAVESAHMGHPDFRVHDKIFATLGYPDAGWGVVMLTPEEQQDFIDTKHAVFELAPGAWGRKGSTRVRLEDADEATVRNALEKAHRRLAAPKTKSKRV
jgi:hypothetical protein